ncbi:MAG: TonB-dependent receptor [Chitinophagaceae bacterium]
MVKFTIILLIAGILGASAKVKSQVVTISAKNVSLDKIFTAIEIQTGYVVFCDYRYIKEAKPLTLNVRRMPLNKVLDKIVEFEDLSYAIEDKTIVISQAEKKKKTITETKPDDITIHGQVKNETGEPLAGAAVKVKSTGKGTITDSLGNFTITVASGDDALLVSMIGYKTTEIAIDNRTNISLVLAQEVRSLDSIIVVGYGTVNKKDLTGAIGTVKAQDITKTATPDPLQAIQGRVSGVQVVSNSGSPGSGVTVKIRGVGSIGGNNPIYVVDGFQTADISYIAPSDIESMDVLKDASATAIYGARGANGVIVITTKKGKTGDIKVDFDAYYGRQQAWRKIPMTNSQQYATLVEEAYANDGSDVPSNFKAKLDSAKNGLIGTTDWQDVVMQNAPMQNYTLAVSGGSKINRFRLSGTFFNQDGIVRNSMMKKYFFNLNDELSPTQWIKAGFNVGFTHYHKTNYNGEYYGGVLTNVLQAEPVIPVYSADGNWSRPSLSYAGNPQRLVDFIKNSNTYGSLLVGNAWAEITFFKGFSLKSQFNATYNNGHTTTYTPEFYIDNVEQNAVSSLYDYRSESHGWLWTNYFNYKKDWGAHRINVMAGAEWQDAYWEESSVTAYDVPADPDLQTLSNTQSTSYTVAANKYASGLQSFFGRANYSYADRYLLTVTVRDDASSKFVKGHRSGIFPAFSGAWVISKEPFFTSNLISFLKLRAGWGRVGNEQSSGAYPYITMVSSNNLYVFGGSAVQGYAPSTFGNTELSWEKNEQTDIGLDVNFLNDHLSLSADVFKRTTKNLILSVPVPIYSGAPAKPSMNTGSMDNKGLELAMNYNGGKNFTYSLGGNVTLLSNKLTSLGIGDVMSLASVGKLGYVSRAEADKPFPYFYGLKTDGIFHNQTEIDSYVNSSGSLIQPNAHPGDVKFVDANGDGSISTSDYVDLGNPNPKVQFGFNASLGYQNFDLTLFAQGVAGNKIVNVLYYDVMSGSNGSGGWRNFMIDRMGRWTSDNTNTDQPRMTATDPNGNMQYSDHYIEKGDYLRMKSIQLGYTLPGKCLSSLKIERLRIYIASDNVFTITGYKGFDPEVGYHTYDPSFTGVDVAGYPQARSYRIGLSLGF